MSHQQYRLLDSLQAVHRILDTGDDVVDRLPARVAEARLVLLYVRCQIGVDIPDFLLCEAIELPSINLVQISELLATELKPRLPAIALHDGALQCAARKQHQIMQGEGIKPSRQFQEYL